MKYTTDYFRDMKDKQVRITCHNGTQVTGEIAYVHIATDGIELDRVQVKQPVIRSKKVGNLARTADWMMASVYVRNIWDVEVLNDSPFSFIAGNGQN